MFNKTFKLTSLALATSVLAACGGGGGGSSSGGSTNPTNPPYQGKDVKGVAVDFYLAGATVKFDDCLENGSPITVKTDAKGQFEFKTKENCKSSALTITGGIDTVTEKPFTGTLKVKHIDLEDEKNATPVASPLTTLEAILPSADFQLVLESLGFDADIDVSKFNPVTEGSAQQLATVFLVQQLLTQIEDAIQDSGSTVDATKVAAEALGTVLKATPLINDDGEFDTNVIDNVVVKAKTEVPAINLINITVSSIADTFNSIGLTGNAAALVELLNTNSDLLEEIQDIINPPASQIPTPTQSEFTTLKIGNYSLLKFQQTTQGKPLLLQQSEFRDITKVDLKLALPDVTKPAIAKIGLEVNASNGKQLELVLDSVKVNFDTSGNPVKAILPANSSIKVSSNVEALKTYTNFTLLPNNDLVLDIVDGQIDLGSFSNRADKLESAFNSFYNEIANIPYTKVETTINMTNYSASESLVIPVIASKNILGITFTNAYNVVGYFKFNPAP